MEAANKKSCAMLANFKSSESFAALISLSFGAALGVDAAVAPTPPPPGSWDPADVAWQPQEMRAAPAEPGRDKSLLLPALLEQQQTVQTASTAEQSAMPAGAKARAAPRIIRCDVAGCDVVLTAETTSDYSLRNRLVRLGVFPGLPLCHTHGLNPRSASRTCARKRCLIRAR